MLRFSEQTTQHTGETDLPEEGVFICIKSSINSTRLWVDDDFEIIAVEVIGRKPGHKWEIIGVYRAPNEDMGAIEKLIGHISLRCNPARRSIIGGDLNLPQANWAGDASKDKGFQVLVNKLIWEEGYTQVVSETTRGDALLDIYLLKPGMALKTCFAHPGISDHKAVILEVEWCDNHREENTGTLVPMFHKTNVLGLQAFLRNKYKQWAETGSSVEEIWGNFKEIIREGINRNVPHKTLSRNPDPEYYNKEVTRLKRKARKAYARKRVGMINQEQLNLITKELLAAKRKAQEAYLSKILQNEGSCWGDFYRYARRRKGNKESIPGLKDTNGGIITDPLEKANRLNSYYASVFSGKRDSQLGITINSESMEVFSVCIKSLRKRLAVCGRKKSVGPDGIPGAILQKGGEAMVPYLVRLMDLSLNNSNLPDDWKKATVIPIYKKGDRALVSNYRPISLTSVVCKQLEHAIAGYIRHQWEMNKWLHERQHGFRPGYSCESQLVTVCQDLAEALDDGGRIDSIIIDFTKAFDLVPHDRLITKIAGSGLDGRVLGWIRDFLTGRSQRVRVDGHLSEEIEVTSGVPQGSVLGPLLFLAYVNDIWRNVDSDLRLFADDCIIYRKIRDRSDIETLQADLNKLMKWAQTNEMTINPGKCKAVNFSKSRIKDRLQYKIDDQIIPEENSFKYLGLIIRSDLNWQDHVNHTLRKAWRSLHFIMRILKKGNSKVKRLGYTALVRPILEYGSSCWDPYRKGQVRALDRVQKRAAKIAKIENGVGWETLEQRRMIARLSALFKAYTGDPAWRDIGKRLRKPCYLGRDDHQHKIRTRKQRTDIGKFSFANRSIRDWNQLPAELLATYPCSLNLFKKRIKMFILPNEVPTS